MQQTEIKAYAKINLELNILGKLADGYHKINSIFQAVTLYDTINISKIKKGFELIGNFVCSPDKNLVSKAKNSLEEIIQDSLPCRIDLQKSIPISAGLGGGSSDAAATLLGLNELFKLNLNIKKLVEIGLKIGSDVPFFLFNQGTARVKGRGEIVKPVKIEIPNFYVIARPHKRVNTAEMYLIHDKTGKNFFDLAKEICPSVRTLYEYFSSLSDNCGMSGSGPSVFAGLNNYEEALKIASGLGKFDGDIFICQPSAKTHEFK